MSKFMDWMKQYGLFLFDFDGLLVNTEEVHFLAYQRMCAKRGVNLDWSFERYCQIAHYRSEGLKEAVYADFPQLHEQQPCWDVLYQEKKQCVIELFDSGAVQLMPGVQAILEKVQQASVRCCVVTHSPKELIESAKRQLPILQTIPYWVTRELYTKPKPDSECYLKAIDEFANPSDLVIGFEDTPRGLTALLGTRAQAVLICKTPYPEIATFLQRGVWHFQSFEDLLK